MSALPKKEHYYTLGEYAELEKVSEERFEYFKGNVWSMAGASPIHEEIVANIITELKNNLRGLSKLSKKSLANHKLQC